MRRNRIPARPAKSILALAFLCAAVAWSPAAAGDRWAVYFYLCGSDLETNFAAASHDLVESLQAELPEDVEFIVLAGGSELWHIDGLDSDTMSILRHTNDQLSFLAKPDNASMGDPETLYQFLKLCEENFPADRKMLIFWNHGGGSGGGICYDELHGGDFLTYGEMKQVFTALYGDEPEEKPFEIIGFDACLMASVDTAGLTAPYARYLVASEEVEPGCGWAYDGILRELAKNPDMDGAELGRVICDTYIEGCEAIGRDGEATLSVIDLSKIDYLAAALSLVSFEGILSLADSPSNFYAQLGRGAAKADGYRAGMVDLAGYVRANSHIFPDFGEIVLDAVKECVVYQRVGPYRKNSNGVSVFIPPPNNDDMNRRYADASAASGMKSHYFLFEPLIAGGLSEEAVAFVEGIPDFLAGLEEEEGDDLPPALLSLPWTSAPIAPEALAGASDFTDTADLGFEDHPLEYVEDDEDGSTHVRLALGGDRAAVLKDVSFVLMMCDEDGSPRLFMGEDADADEDWEEGEFTESFRGVWGSLDGRLVAMHITSRTDEYILYEVPLFIDGRLYNLTVAYDYEDETYRPLTARLDESETGGIPPREERLLVKGDEIGTIFLIADDDGELVPFENETFTLEGAPVFEETTLPDGLYGFAFLMTDARDNHYTSDIAFMRIEDGETEVVRE